MRGSGRADSSRYRAMLALCLLTAFLASGLASVAQLGPGWEVPPAVSGIVQVLSILVLALIGLAVFLHFRSCGPVAPPPVVLVIILLSLGFAGLAVTLEWSGDLFQWPNRHPRLSRAVLLSPLVVGPLGAVLYRMGGRRLRPAGDLGAADDPASGG